MVFGRQARALGQRDRALPGTSVSSADGRIRCEKASADADLFYPFSGIRRFQIRRFFENSLEWTGPKCSNGEDRQRQRTDVSLKQIYQFFLERKQISPTALTNISINLLVVYRESVNLIGYITRRLSADSQQL